MPEQFYLLEKGDIIKGTKPHAAPRMILRVSKRYGKTYYVELLKLRPSWTKHHTTLYCAGDSFQFLPVKVRDKRIWDMTYDKLMARRKKIYKNHARKLIRRAEQRIRNLRSTL